MPRRLEISLHLTREAVYVTEEDPSAIDENTDQKMWTIETDDLVNTPPVVIDDTIYVCSTHDDLVYALEEV